jgi:hypothetical protein
VVQSEIVSEPVILTMARPTKRLNPEGARSRIRFLALRLVLVLERVPDGLDPDQPVSKHERVDPVVHASALRVCRPLEQQDVLLVDLGRQVPFGLRDVGEELGERLPDPVLPRRTPSGVMKIASSE